MRDEYDFSKARRGPAIPSPETTPLPDATRGQHAAETLLSLADRVAEAGIDPMSMAAIQAEVQATRQEQRGRPTHDAVVPELMSRPGVRQEVERIERQEDMLAEEFILKDMAWGLRGQD
jgi:hypothetical protein